VHSPTVRSDFARQCGGSPGRIGRSALLVTSTRTQPSSASRYEPVSPDDENRLDNGWSRTAGRIGFARTSRRTTGRSATPAPVRPVPAHDGDAAGRPSLRSSRRLARGHLSPRGDEACTVVDQASRPTSPALSWRMEGTSRTAGPGRLRPCQEAAWPRRLQMPGCSVCGVRSIRSSRVTDHAVYGPHDPDCDRHRRFQQMLGLPGLQAVGDLLRVHGVSAVSGRSPRSARVDHAPSGARKVAEGEGADEPDGCGEGDDRSTVLVCLGHHRVGQHCKNAAGRERENG
jgi:hypothetical protein